jgi:hypothetical protein
MLHEALVIIANSFTLVSPVTLQVLVVCSDDELLKALVEANKLLDAVQKGLNDYLETKRLAFPRWVVHTVGDKTDCVAPPAC